MGGGPEPQSPRSQRGPAQRGCGTGTQGDIRPVGRAGPCTAAPLLPPPRPTVPHFVHGVTFGAGSHSSPLLPLCPNIMSIVLMLSVCLSLNIFLFMDEELKPCIINILINLYARFVGDVFNFCFLLPASSHLYKAFVYGLSLRHLCEVFASAACTEIICRTSHG